MNINATETNGFFGVHEMTAGVIERVYVREVDFFVQALFDRLLPTFNNLEAEADEFARNEYISAQTGYQAESGFDRSADLYVSMMNLRQSIINLHAVGLSHLFEQQIYSLTSILEFGRRDSADFKKDKNLLKTNGKIDIENLMGWQSIKELRLLCNAVKHAEGNSTTKLRQLNPAFFEPQPDKDEYLQEVRTDINNLIGSGRKDYLPGPIKNPLAGEDIYVKEEDIKKYADAIKEFWSDFIRWLLETP